MKTKTIMMTLMMCLFLSGCSKDEDIQPPQQNCSCGIIANDGITNSCYWLEVRNDCSNNKKKFCFDQDIWFNNFVGDKICITNEIW